MVRSKSEGDYFSTYQINIISKYPGTIKSMLAQNKSSMHVQLSDSGIIRNGENGVCPAMKLNYRWFEPQARNCIWKPDGKVPSPRKKDDSFICTYTCYSRYLLAMGIGLDWIAASAVQTLKTSMWVGLSRSCFKLKLHFPIHHVRPATIYSYDFPLGCIFCPYRAYKWYSRVYPLPRFFNDGLVFTYRFL